MAGNVLAPGSADGGRKGFYLNLFIGEPHLGKQGEKVDANK
jgi:hypothetical protein